VRVDSAPRPRFHLRRGLECSNFLFWRPFLHPCRQKATIVILLKSHEIVFLLLTSLCFYADLTLVCKFVDSILHLLRIIYFMNQLR